MEKIITGNNEDEVWQQIHADLQNNDILQYHAIIEQEGRKIILDIDIDLGGGFEGGYATTSFLAPVTADDFRFSIRKQGLLEEAGKLLGMQDIQIGDASLDSHFLMQTNNEARLKSVFLNSTIRDLLSSLSHLPITMKLTAKEDNEEPALLKLAIEEEITDPIQLRKIYHDFYHILTIIQTPPK